jgi:uncharacterized protein
MLFDDLPRSAAWRHRGAREGFEVVLIRPNRDRVLFEGGTAAVEEGHGWFVDYMIEVGPGWSTQSARVNSRSATGVSKLRLEADAAGGWRVNGAEAPHLDGCVDVDLESSSLTNAFPVRRLRLEVGRAADAPAAYVRAVDLTVERLEQRYVRLDNDRSAERYHYTAPRFGFACELIYDATGLVADYPGIAIRVA